MRGEVRRSRVSTEPSEKGFVAVYAFAPELSVFEGHFPGRPLVPGVFLIEAVRQAAEATLESPLRLVEIVDARFTAPLGPGQPVRLSVELAPEALEVRGPGWVARVTAESEGVACARLRLRLGAFPG